ncbi:MAG: hormogonium polysaccharide biosynthesis protein HpsA [Leptolyngbyaceae bacterium]|nr:hormogonium polysaccharide biosynthesis protein HpsA [Leptolyngbyaceae bacterium]
MSNQKIVTALRRLLSGIQRFAQNLTRRFVLWLFRGLLLVNRQPKSIRGFVLPTTVLLLLLVTLTVGAITLRTYDRTNQAVGERQQRVIYNAATPAIDRAKAKLEFLFNRERDPRFPSGIPSQAALNGMLINDGEERDGVLISPFLIENDTGSLVDPYTFPDEQVTASGLANAIDVDGNGQADRLDLNEDGFADNAWAFRADTDGDGDEDATVAYSIILMRPLIVDPDDPDPLESVSDDAMAARAALLQVRHGPLSLNNSDNPACAFGEEGQGDGPEQGWFEDPAVSSILRKNFQVDVYVLPDDANGTVSTLEFHQDRQMDRGNKWGAWFRNDLEIFPGPRFNWNGAMHTEGNLIVGNSSFRGFLLSSPASCLYNRASSEVTIADVQADPEENVPAFQGQFMSALTGSNSFGHTNYFHIHGDKAITESAAYGGNQYTITDGNETKFTQGNDSVPNNTPKPIDYTLDPVILTTQNVSKARGIDGDDTPEDFRENAWADRQLVKDGRLYNQSEDTPYVDDSFRADNRYGPGPRVSGRSIPGFIGEPIVNDQLDNGTRPIKDIELIRTVPPEGDDEGVELGLDGYWDRRARDHGLRILVGERLELGNAYGWGGGINGETGQYRKAADDEPLLPWDECKANNNNRCNEARQRRALHDNLAAVQSAVFYHASADTVTNDDSSRDFPTACMASTVHPGSSESLILSSAFKDWSTDVAAFIPPSSTLYIDNPVMSNFFMGIGTNGWEYDPVPPSVNDETGYAQAIDPLRPLGIALRHLAYFAGDPEGGAPSFTPVDNTNDSVVHPYPWLSMWGDFSLLRRVLAQLDGLSADQGNPFDGTSVSYADLSPADKATLHAASCTIGMLAYNIGFLEAIDYNRDSAALTALENRITTLLQGGTRPPTGVREIGGTEQNTPEAFIASLKQWNQRAPGDVPQSMVSLAEMIVLKEQVSRDRRYGFDIGYSANAEGIGAATFNLPNVGSGNLTKLTTDWLKFPSLHYLFPGDITDSAGGDPDGVIDQYDIVEEKRLNNSVYRNEVRDRVIEDRFNTINGNQVEYQPFDLLDNTTLNQLVVLPRPIGEWNLPWTNRGPGNTVLSNEPNGVMIGCMDNSCGGSPGASVFNRLEVGFKDAVIFNGREYLPARSMDVNIDLIRQSTSSLTGDSWLPNTGIIYAFREDAVREDEITRPTNIGGNASSAWNTCGRDEVFSDPSAQPDCYMDAGDVNAFDSSDPPLNDQNRVSPKPVDYYPDPERRPYGFRLRNGQKVWRATDTDGRGLSFITDNPVYIMGDFNLHQTLTCNGQENCRLEEFTQKLNDNFNNFYSRDTLDPRFARPATDQWRPSEILSDAITVISERFCDGSAEDIPRTVTESNNAQLNGSFVTNLYGCQDSGNRTSFLNLGRIEDRPARVTMLSGEREYWLHANPYDSLFYGTDWKDRLRFNTPITPVLWSRNGNPITLDGPSAEYSRRYYEFRDGKPLISTQTNRVNAIVISGLTPSRAGQAYGGLHNFPRFIENWNTLYISGSLLQLQFSRYATAPFSQNSWESGSPPTGGEQIKYYSPPNRRWGYDVGLQYAPAGPLASRFVSISTTPRSEFYSEPPADDPYLLLLCEQISDEPCQP